MSSCDPAVDERPLIGGRRFPQKLEYQPAIDGLRALAVIAVMTYHQGHLVGGFLGVDVFFVLSGFLITSLLLIDYGARGRVLSAGFWARRARRLFPAILVLLALVAVYTVLVATPPDYSSIRGGALATLFYVQNYWLIGHRTHGHYPLSHTWSLSIEEQFYLIWPILLAVILRVTRRVSYVTIAMVILVIASATYMWHQVDHRGIAAAYFPLQARAQELLVGALLAVVLLGWRGPKTRVRGIALEVAGLLAFVLLLVLSFRVPSNAVWLFHGGFLLVAVASAVLVAACVSPASQRIRSVLSLRPLVAIGLISYGLYLFHIPLYGLINAQHVVTNEAGRVVLKFGITFLFATASYRLIEKPIRSGRLLSTAQVRVVAPIATVCAVGLVFVSTNGATTPSFVDVAGASYAHMATSTPQGSQRVLVAGDQLVQSLGLRLKLPYAQGGIQGTIASAYGCDGLAGSSAVGNAVYPPAQTCSKVPSLLASAATNFRPNIAILMLGPSAVVDRIVNGRRLVFGSAAFEKYLDGQLDKIRTLLSAHGARFILATVPCMSPPSGGPFSALASAQRDPRRVVAINQVIHRYADTHHLAVLEYDAFLCRSGKLVARANRSGDGVGLSIAGAAATWRWIAQSTTAGLS